MAAERYLNHPTFGMLYLVAPAGEGRDVYATLYAQRMFFLVTLQPRGAVFEVIPTAMPATTPMFTFSVANGRVPPISRIGSNCLTRHSSGP